MGIQTRRVDGILVCSIQGRIDGYGAQKLAEAVTAGLYDDDSGVVLDLEGVRYISSAGIRVFLSLKKDLKGRNGTLALCSVGGYPKKVLDMAGVMPIFDSYATCEEALSACTRSADSLSVLAEIESPSRERDGIRYSIEPGGTGEGRLRVTGHLENVLYARLTAGDIRALHFSDTAYSLGLGALGGDISEALPLLGEMITLHGSMVWLPSDGHNTPDFLTPLKDTGEVQIYTGFNVALDGPFHEIISVESVGEEGIRLSDLYGLVFALGKERKRSESGIIAIAMWAVSGGVCSSGIRRAPIREFAPAGGASILDAEQQAEWLSVETEPCYRGDTMVTFGFGVDLTADRSPIEEKIEAVAYTHPSEERPRGMYLHNHGVIFRRIPWDRTPDLNQQIKKIVSDGEFVDMRHLLDSTTIRRAKLGVTYISDIILDAE